MGYFRSGDRARRRAGAVRAADHQQRGNSGSQATSLIIRALALRELRLRDWWKVCGREIAAGLVLGAFLGAIGFFRIVLWQRLRFVD